MHMTWGVKWWDYLTIGKHRQNKGCIFVGYANKEKMLSFGELWYHKAMYP